MASTPSFRERLRAGELLIGPMVTLSSPEVSELLSGLGFDWLFIDTEHTPMGAPEVQAILQAAGPTPCIIRLPSDENTPIAKALDAGAAGIMVPMVNSADQTREIVAASRYAPAGRRGRGLARAHGYGLKLAEYSATANDTVAVIVQAEHKDAVKNIRSIVRVEGLDAVLIGPYDLASSLGHPGDVTHPDVREAIAMVRTACLEVKMPVGILGIAAETAREYIAQGFTLIIAGIDVLLLGDAARTLLDQVKQK